jgi:hypothetical protein
VDWTSVKRGAPGQLDSGELLLFERHNKPLIAKRERPLRAPVINAQTEGNVTEGEPLTMRSFPIEYVLLAIRSHHEQDRVSLTR